MAVPPDAPPGSAASSVASGASTADDGVLCSVCGACATAPPPLTWSISRSERGPSYACEACTRRHLRSMEAQLSQEHW